jgi:hypothetical protein
MKFSEFIKLVKKIVLSIWLVLIQSISKKKLREMGFVE